MSTNITRQHQDAFDAIASGRYRNFALFSCFVNGEPASALVAVNPCGDEFAVTPLFVSVTPGMVITDHNGVEPQAEGGWPCAR